MSFTFNTGIPAAANDPSVDQPDMLTNNVSTDAILAVDHVTFNTASGGTHKQITLSSKNVPGVQTDPASTLYSNSGTASSVAQLFFRSQNGTFQVSPIKAWAFCSGAGTITASQSSNVSTVTRTSAGNYDIVLTANAVNSANFAVLMSSALSAANRTLIIGYTITGVGTFSLKFTNTIIVDTDPISFSFSVIQI